MNHYVAAIDQGTTSTRCLIFDDATTVISVAQAEHKQIYPRSGWVEHDPQEIWQKTQIVVREALDRSGAKPGQNVAVGVTNQRETTVIWNRHTGEPYGNAIVWQDTRTKELCDQLADQEGPDRFRDRTGLPLSTYFAGPKISWALDHIDGLREAAELGEAIFGTIDSWLIWWLTGGPESSGGANHVTDVTNASRTLLMNLQTLEWDDQILDVLRIPRHMLPRIVPSSDSAGFGMTTRDGPFGHEIPICGALGDQHAAMLGQCCFKVGDIKNTYGTGCFMLMNTGHEPVVSRSGLLTTVCYQFAGEKPIYALEGSVAIAGALVQWLRDNLELIKDAGEIESLARTVDDSAGIYVVPAFSGLFAPHWRADARGVIVGLTGYVNKAHLARAVLEATCYQTREVLDAMLADSTIGVETLKVDGGMVVNELLMQCQADVLGIPVVRPKITETTVLGAAYAAGMAVGLYGGRADLRTKWQTDRTWEPQMSDPLRERLYAGWSKAVQRSLDWVE